MSKNILITGAAKRIGAACARLLHSKGCNIVLHYRTSEKDAFELCTDLNAIRSNSAITLQADLLSLSELENLAFQSKSAWGRLDVLINNASSFYPTDINDVSENEWEDLLGSNLKAPFFLSKFLAPELIARKGCIINVADIHAERGLKDYPVYSIAKSGLVAMTKVLAKELGPEVRVNAVAPGAILWPEANMSDAIKEEILNRIALRRSGAPEDIAKTASFLIEEADYITGQVIAVDGGRTLFC